MSSTEHPSSSSEADASTKAAADTPNGSNSRPRQEIAMNKNQVFFVLLTVMMSIFLVALDRTIITTVWRFSHCEIDLR